MHNHLVYHVSLLEKAAENPYPGQLVPSPSLVIVNDEEEFVVEEILDARLFGRGKKLKYLMKWLGYPDPDWQDAEAVNKLQAVDVFHQYVREQGGVRQDWLVTDETVRPGLHARRVLRKIILYIATSEGRRQVVA